MDDERRWSVYVHINKANGKRYYGITSMNPKRRWSRGRHYTGCTHFYNAIKHYGWDGFEHKVIVSKITKSFAEIIERGMIEHHKTTDPNFGYNIQPGGLRSGGLSEEGLQSIRECNTGLNAKNRKPVVVFDLSGKKVAEFGYMRAAAKFLGVAEIYNHVHTRHGTVGGHIVRLKSDVGDMDQLPPEVVSDARSTKYKDGRPSAHVRPVTVFDAATGERLGDFPTIRMASAHFGTNLSTIFYNGFGSLNGLTIRETKDCVGKDRLSQEELYEIARVRCWKEVFQFSEDRTFIRSFPSLKDAARETGTSYKTLSMCLRGKCSSAGGFLWSCSRDKIPEKAKTAWESRIENGTKAGTPVDQIDLETGKVVASYRSIGEAAKAANTYISSISEVVKHIGNHRSAGGFGWEYHEPGRG